MFSFWEKSTLLKSDIVVAGAGLTGLMTALRLSEKYPKKDIVVLEKGPIPSGASTRNAGFACFGSLAELVAMENETSLDHVMALVEKRIQGLHDLRHTLGDENIEFIPTGGGEGILQGWTDPYPHIEKYNDAFEHLNGMRPFYADIDFPQKAGWNSEFLTRYIHNSGEGMIDTGKMMFALWKRCAQQGIRILTGWTLLGYEIQTEGVEVKTTEGTFFTKALALCLNGYSGPFLADEQVNPGRGQVLVTAPLPELQFKGIFHLAEGYVYFRNVGSRILLGGGRHLDKSGETTLHEGVTEKIQKYLEDLLYKFIIPNRKAPIEYRWSGIMGFGEPRKPYCKQVSARVFAAGRLQGMGVALGTRLAFDLVDKMEESGMLS